MEKEVKMATFVGEDGVEYELEVIKEFNHKDKKYAVLYEDGCDCDECDSDDTCDCDENCDDDCECDCHNDDDDCNGRIYVLEVVKDEEGKEVYNEVDPSMMEELIAAVEKELYPTEE